MIIKSKMINFNVEMYNDKITKLDSLIYDLNDIITKFYNWGEHISLDFLKRLMDRPAETFHKRLNYECISQGKYDFYCIDEDDYDAPNYMECYRQITYEMLSILKAYYKFCLLLPYIKEAYSSSLFFVKEEEPHLEPCVVKTKNAEWRIMQQCAEYENYKMDLYDAKLLKYPSNEFGLIPNELSVNNDIAAQCKEKGNPLPLITLKS
ncbi:hypothetical protein KSZ02_08490 [Bacteroides thetaiotaomicron]|uniref:hypothetical protein n=1 Tax=Bacteroides thetaiotaomicron TaxID=818 RepID=UPI001C37D683|nr:hypothetical protein [Bacteroides thetaiotaomicron]MBV4088419.1 hypothetical protein [Bacteroides thetaiotaomicron]MBV4100255.1 hypothetical protein [Bacteroides thetaiotaomicron]MBV4135984.1 hypothetical protein [Bacteroides thetaiotaomicron]MCS2964162.1 hypothetical protein [Bacteroides thetaiotaomicron]